MSNARNFSADEARKIAAMIGLDFSKCDIPLEEFRMGLHVELEHGRQDIRTNVTNDDLVTTGKIAWAHLNEFPDYYTRLDKLESEAEAAMAAKKKGK